VVHPNSLPMAFTIGPKRFFWAFVMMTQPRPFEAPAPKPAKYRASPHNGRSCGPGLLRLAGIPFPATHRIAASETLPQSPVKSALPLPPLWPFAGPQSIAPGPTAWTTIPRQPFVERHATAPERPYSAPLHSPAPSLQITVYILARQHESDV
jgi:hypothetical protein